MDDGATPEEEGVAEEEAYDNDDDMDDPEFEIDVLSPVYEKRERAGVVVGSSVVVR